MDQLKSNIIKVLNIMEKECVSRAEKLVLFLLVRSVVQHVERHLAREEGWQAEAVWAHSMAAFLRFSAIHVTSHSNGIYVDVDQDDNNKVRYNISASAPSDSQSVICNKDKELLKDNTEKTELENMATAINTEISDMSRNKLNSPTKGPLLEDTMIQDKNSSSNSEVNEGIGVNLTLPDTTFIQNDSSQFLNQIKQEDTQDFRQVEVNIQENVENSQNMVTLYDEEKNVVYLMSNSTKIDDVIDMKFDDVTDIIGDDVKHLISEAVTESQTLSCQKSAEVIQEDIPSTGIALPDASEEIPVLFLSENGKIDEELSDPFERTKRSYNKIENMDEARTCSICGRTFHNPSNLKVHMRSHKGDAPFACSLCSARFTTRANMLRHESTTHRGEKCWSCDLCHKRFTEKKSMVTHKQTVHLKQRPFECKECGKTFTQRGPLNTHLLRHWGSRDHQCLSCDRRFLTKPQLTAHRKQCTQSASQSCHTKKNSEASTDASPNEHCDPHSNNIHIDIIAANIQGSESNTAPSSGDILLVSKETNQEHIGKEIINKDIIQVTYLNSLS